MTYSPLSEEQVSELRAQLNDFGWPFYLRRLALLLGSEEALHVSAGCEDGTASAGGRIVAVTRTRLVRLEWDPDSPNIRSLEHTRAWAVPLKAITMMTVKSSWRAIPGADNNPGWPDDEVSWVLRTHHGETVALPVARYGSRLPDDVVALLSEAMTS